MNAYPPKPLKQVKTFARDKIGLPKYIAFIVTLELIFLLADKL